MLKKVNRKILNSGLKFNQTNNYIANVFLIIHNIISPIHFVISYRSRNANKK